MNDDRATWAIERPTFSIAEEDALVAALRSRDIPTIEFTGRAFDSNDAIQDAAVPRGSCYFVLQASRWPAWDRAFWGDPQDYDCSRYYAKLGSHLLNHDHRLMSANEFCWTAADIAPEWKCDALFVRPDDGFKSFEGSVVRIDELEAWRVGLALQQVRFSSPVLVSRPIAIQNEWRLQIVDGRVVAMSQYKPSWQRGAPDDVVRYAESVQREVRWPARAFVMDIALTDHGLAIIEIGCLLCTGFYESDPGAIVDALRPLVESG